MTYISICRSIFTNNKWLTIYLNLISRALNREINKSQYFESHHIIPKSISPEYIKEEWNLVRLTAREHYICHRILPKITIGKHKKSMIHALWGMTNQRNKFQKRYIVNGHQYELAKIQMIQQLSAERKGKSLEERYGKERAHLIRDKLKLRPPRPSPNEEERLKFSERVKKNHQNGVYKKTGFNGRKLPRISCVHCGKECDVGNHARHHGDNCKLRFRSEEV